MSIKIPFGYYSVTFINPAELTSRGSTIYDWDDPERTTVEGCSIASQEGSEDLNARYGDKEVLRIKWPYGAYKPSGVERVEARGAVYEITDIKHYPDIEHLAHSTCLAIRWEG